MDVLEETTADSPRQFEAHAMLLQAVEPDLVDFVSGFDTPALAWKALADINFSLIYLLRSLIDLRMSVDALL